MYSAVHNEISQQDIFISAAAVADYKPAILEQQKIKRQNQAISIPLEPTIDILQTIGKLKLKPFIVGFAAETENIVENAKIKLQKKACDLIIVNDVSQQDIGFESDNNAVTILSKEHSVYIEKTSKKILARKLLKIIHEYELTRALPFQL